MLIQRSIADDLLYKYQAVMMYLNGGLLPNGALEFAAIRPEIYNCLDEINDAMSGVVGGDFVNNLRRAVYGKFIYLKNYKDGYAFMHIETGAFYMAFALTTRIEELSKEYDGKVKIGKVIHEEKAQGHKNTEIAIDNIRLDQLTKEYLTEIKKSDADEEAAKWQLLFYLSILKSKGIVRKGKLEFVEKNRKDKKVVILELTEEAEKELQEYIKEIEQLLAQDEPPECIHKSTCKKCAYYEYCYI